MKVNLTTKNNPKTKEKQQTQKRKQKSKIVSNKLFVVQP